MQWARRFWREVAIVALIAMAAAHGSDAATLAGPYLRAIGGSLRGTAGASFAWQIASGAAAAAAALLWRSLPARR